MRLVMKRYILYRCWYGSRWLAAVVLVWHFWNRLLLLIFMSRSGWPRNVRVGFSTLWLAAIFLVWNL